MSTRKTKDVNRPCASSYYLKRDPVCSPRGKDGRREEPCLAPSVWVQGVRPEARPIPAPRILAAASRPLRGFRLSGIPAPRLRPRRPLVPYRGTGGPGGFFLGQRSLVPVAGLGARPPLPRLLPPGRPPGPVPRSRPRPQEKPLGGGSGARREEINKWAGSGEFRSWTENATTNLDFLFSLTYNFG